MSPKSLKEPQKVSKSLKESQESQRAKEPKVSKSLQILWNDFLQNFLLLFTSLLPAPVAKNNNIYVRIYFIFLKNILKQNL